MQRPRRRDPPAPPPQARKKFGLLEKKSDYKLRSDNYHKRQARLKTLQRKAQERNPDEFAFGMIGTVAGERRGPEGSASTHAATAKLKSEDLRYVRMAKVPDGAQKIRGASRRRRGWEMVRHSRRGEAALRLRDDARLVTRCGSGRARTS